MSDNKAYFEVRCRKGCGRLAYSRIGLNEAILLWNEGVTMERPKIKKRGAKDVILDEELNKVLEQAGADMVAEGSWIE